MKWIWGFLFLLGCSPEYGVSPNDGLADILVDTATYVTTSTTIPTRIPEAPDDVDFVPLIFVDPIDYDFGDLPINCHDEYDLTISSIGTAPLVIEDLMYINTPELSMDTEVNLPFTLAPGEDLVITFSYDEEDTL